MCIQLHRPIGRHPSPPPRPSLLVVTHLLWFLSCASSACCPLHASHCLQPSTPVVTTLLSQHTGPTAAQGLFGLTLPAPLCSWALLLYPSLQVPSAAPCPALLLLAVSSGWKETNCPSWWPVCTWRGPGCLPTTDHQPCQDQCSQQGLVGGQESTLLGGNPCCAGGCRLGCLVAPLRRTTLWLKEKLPEDALQCLMAQELGNLHLPTEEGHSRSGTLGSVNRLLRHCRQAEGAHW